MSSRNTSIVINSCLIGTGLLAWAYAAGPLTSNRDIALAPNPLGIKRSPYGEVFAIAMQGGIDQAFHEGVMGNNIRDLHDLDHGHGDCHGHEHGGQNEVQDAPSLKIRFQNALTSLSNLPLVRTNPKPAAKALRFQLRRNAEDKLRFAYDLDPSNYANYASLHFFLTEPSVGTRPELTDSSLKLAEDTIAYCLKDPNDPRPSLTAAAACTNVLSLMFDDRRKAAPKYTISQMREYLVQLDHCIARYDDISARWTEEKSWDLLSPQRIAECQDRSDFIRKIRDAAEKTILIFEGKITNSQASN